MRARLNQYHLAGNCDSRRHSTSSLTENAVVTETRSSRMLLEMLLFFDKEKTSSQISFVVEFVLYSIFLSLLFLLFSPRGNAIYSFLLSPTKRMNAVNVYFALDCCRIVSVSLSRFPQVPEYKLNLFSNDF